MDALELEQFTIDWAFRALHDYNASHLNDVWKQGLITTDEMFWVVIIGGFELA